MSEYVQLSWTKSWERTSYVMGFLDYNDTLELITGPLPTSVVGEGQDEDEFFVLFDRALGLVQYMKLLELFADYAKIVMGRPKTRLVVRWRRP